MKLLLFSDLHLDAPFAWCGRDAARIRRQRLRDVLSRIVRLAREREVDAVLCGGDLYEHDRYSPDTMEFLRREFEVLHPVPIYLAPGNHDFFGPESLYSRVEWPENVHIFETPRFESVELADGLTLWGAAHCAPACGQNLLDGFEVGRGGVHLGLFHGSENGCLRFQGTDKKAHAPFSERDIERAGLQHAFLGHYHRPNLESRFTYPGNPDPLTFGEEGDRGVVIATIEPNGTVERTCERVALSQIHDLELDVSGCTTRQAVLARVNEQLASLTGSVRLTLCGEIASSVDLHPYDFPPPPELEALQVRLDRLRVQYDLESIQKEETVRGQFVRDVLTEEALSESERRDILVTGLRALEGRDDLEVL